MSDQDPGPADPPPAGPGDDMQAAGARVALIAVGFAAFAAYVAADFATGGRLTAWVIGLFAALGRAGPGDGETL